MNTPTKEIVYRGGVIRFRIPSHWQEHYEPDGRASFFEPGNDNRTFFVNVITSQPEPDAEADSFWDVMKGLQETNHADIERLPNGHIKITVPVSRFEDRGHELACFRWLIGSELPPDRLRIATFSYVVPLEESARQSVLDVVSMLNESVSEVFFSQELGI